MNGLTDFLSWLTGTGGGAFILVAWAVSWGLEGLPWWDTLTSKLKQLIILGTAVVLGLLGVWLNSMPAVVAVIEPYFRVVMYVVLAWLSTQVAHKLDPKAK
jgi:hypothetical protein